MYDQLRDHLRATLDIAMPELVAGMDGDEGALPQVVDFVLVVATEDVSNPLSDTYYHIVSSQTGHYRTVGLLKCALASQLNGE
jgi:hypothetical protein